MKCQKPSKIKAFSDCASTENAKIPTENAKVPTENAKVPTAFADFFTSAIQRAYQIFLVFKISQIFAISKEMPRPRRTRHSLHSVAFFLRFGFSAWTTITGSAASFFGFQLILIFVSRSV